MMESEPSPPKEGNVKNETERIPAHVLYDNPMFLMMSGIIGVGKTTLADKLGGVLGCSVHHELGADTEKLQAFYADKHKYSFSLQVHLLTKRFKQHQLMVYRGEDSIVDRSIYEDAVFAQVLHSDGFMTKNEYSIYLELARVIHNSIRRPTAIIHLDTTPEIALQRIKTRGRSWEAGIKLEYLQHLSASYDVFIKEISKEIPVIRFKWKFEPVEKVAQAIADELKSMHMIRDVSL
jgi:deoxyadenosine/deoxycytidine kinase